MERSDHRGRRQALGAERKATKKPDRRRPPEGHQRRGAEAPGAVRGRHLERVKRGGEASRASLS